MKNEQIPSFLTHKKSILKFLLFVALFAFTFIIIYKPFGSMIWLDNMNFDTYFIYTGMIVLCGFIVLTISRFLLYRIQKKKELTLKHYIYWLILEILVIAVGCSLVGFTINKNHSMTFLEILPRVFFYSLSILAIPYIVSGLYSALKDKNRRIQEFMNTKKELKDNYLPTDLIKFYDKNDNLRFSVKFEYLLYLESFGNYVKICYLNNDKISRYILRNTFSNVVEQYCNKQLVRCHRFYIVNIDNVQAVRKERNGYTIEMEASNAPIIPISKSYIEQFMQLIS